MRTKDMPFRNWTKKEITDSCLRNGYGEPRFSGKKRIMYIKEPVSNWAKGILNHIAGIRLGYSVQYN